MSDEREEKLMTTDVRTDTVPDTRAYRTVNPATGEVVREYASASREGAETLLAQAHSAYLSWRATSVAERARLLGGLADVMEGHSEELAQSVTAEMGKPLASSRREALWAASIFRYYSVHGEALLADEETDVPGLGRVVTRREPVGVVLGIEPWNAPLYQAVRATAPNLMLGNTVLLKPSEVSAGSTLWFDRLFADAGFPEHVYQTALVTTDQVADYIADDRVRAVTLTGSDRAGSAVGELAGRHVKPVVLELGGSDAFVVLDSADVSAAAATAASCRLILGGQVCASPKRVIALDAVADAFIAEYVDGFASQKIGDPLDPETTVGPLSSVAAADRLQEQYEDAVQKGATVLLEGGRMDGPGAFFKPAVITDITPGMRVYTEEAFGPLGMIYRVPNAEAAIELANSSAYGLGGTVFGEASEASRIAEQLDTGAVGINRFFGAPIEIGFGGTKRSGVGRELGRSGMDPFANIKSYALAS
jgi:succinate-semialdehyde dehydrogenase / glutarate-semialdehyde dehydrogenase